MSIKSLVSKINKLRNIYAAKTDEELIKDANTMREIKNKKDILPDAFALVREASKRAIGKEHYDVQLMGGIALYDGKIAEAKTGEGKTITIYLPAFLSALEGKGVHVVTVNDYLANRDATEARKVFDMLGMSVGCVLNNSTKEERKEAYECDITYVTNSELGFDYLKDNLASHPNDLVLRGLHYAIIDEVDSILIDEAKTPLIISGAGPEVDSILEEVDFFVKDLKAGKLIEATTVEKLTGWTDAELGDFIINEKENQIYLTESGIEKMTKTFGEMDYQSARALSLQKMVNNALRANYLMFLDKDYVVRDDKVEIVDTFTGRVLPGRRFSDGLHQALEIKEGVTVQQENLTIATITFQSFFNKYNKKAGLTGTAMTSKKEFKEIYNLDVVEIPTNKPVVRKDYEDAVFRTKAEKWASVVESTALAHSVGQPVLIGTASIEDSEIVSKKLTERGIEHNVLNAKNEALEAEIIAKAGEFGAVTVATNMAGRGTDIILSEESKNVGGLKVIGTERHDSKRIDNQLKGRSGRQGDVGESQFYISLEDRVMRVFGDAGSLDTLMMMSTEPGQPLQLKTLSKMIAKAQDAVETENRLVREHMVKYDEANNEHREQIYEQRRGILLADNPREYLKDMFDQVTDDIVDAHTQNGDSSEYWDLDGIINDFHNKIAMINLDFDVAKMNRQQLKDAFHQVNDLLIDLKENEMKLPDLINFVERGTMLRFIDRHWAMFLSSMEYVKNNVGAQSYAQRDPVIEYRNKGVALFNQMIGDIQRDVVLNFMRSRIVYENPEEDNNSEEGSPSNENTEEENPSAENE